MVNVLIATKPDDNHSYYVKLALERKGHRCTLWFTADIPTLQTHSFSLSGDQVNWTARGTEFVVNPQDKFDVVWVRRPRKPVLPDSIHPYDKENAENEIDALYKTCWQVIAPQAFWINPVESIKTVNCKLKQLQVAAEVGLAIPDTLISNDPANIKTFIQRYPVGQVIYKTLYPVMWLSEEEMRLTYTKEIRLENLPSDIMLQNTPGIFQKKVPKAYELRVTFLGDCAVAAKLRSQEHPRGIMDWRYVPTKELSIDPYTLPKSVQDKCKAFMRKLGIVFGCFDFIVTPDKEYYFLEVNEQGQFLWVEEVNPSIRLLDAFTDFMIQQKREFCWTPKEESVLLSDFIPELLVLRKNAMTMHKEPSSIY